MKKFSYAASFAALAAIASLPLPARADWLYVPGNPGSITDGDGNVLKARAYASGTLNYEDWMAGKIYVDGYTTITTGDLDFSQPVADANGTEYEIGGISRSVFNETQSIRSVVLAPSIRQLGYQCFRRCYNLKSLTIPENSLLEKMGTGDTYGYNGAYGQGQCFNSCTALEGYITLPDTVTTLPGGDFSQAKIAGFYAPAVTNYGAQVFDSCTSLKAIEFGDDVQAFGKETFIRGNAGVTVFWHAAPSARKGFDENNDNGNICLTRWAGNVHYIPYDAATGTATSDWLAYQAEFVAKKYDGKNDNVMTFPETIDGEGTWYLGGRAQYAMKIKFWDPSATSSAALLAY